MNQENSRRRPSEAGMTLLEVVIALGILLVVSAGLTGVAAVSVIATENQGHQMARTAEYAQDKMEQLLSLEYGDANTDTVTPGCVMYLQTQACYFAGSGEVGLTPGGSSDPAAAVNHYVDYLDATGTPLGGLVGGAAPATWFYERVWEICFLQLNGTCNTATDKHLKRITVTATVKSAVASTGQAPKSTLTSLKADYQGS